MMRVTHFFMAAIAVVFVLAGCSTMPKKPDSLTRGDYGYTKEYVSWLIKKEMRENDVTGLSIALVDDQRVVWAQGFGVADEANKVPATPDTIYRVGSISKLFTATAVLQLAEQGKMDIDKPLSTYLPEFSVKSRFPDAGPITPRTLMTHHSGLPSDFLKGMWTKYPEPITNVVNLLKDEYAQYPPNFVFSYSNLGVSLLGNAVERIAGRPYASQMDETVLHPLGMASSSFYTHSDVASRLAKGYRNGKEIGEPQLRDIPAGGLHTNVLDLSRFMEMVFAGGKAGERRILKGETLAEMLSPQNDGVPLDHDFHIGLGWLLTDVGIENAGKVAWHDGATLLYRSQMVILPEQKLGVVVLSNSATAAPVVHKVATEALKLAMEAKAGIRQPERNKPVEREADLSPEERQKLAGAYVTPFGTVKVIESGTTLRTELFGKTFSVVPRNDGRMGLRYRLLGVIPISLGDLDYLGFSTSTVSGHNVLLATAAGKSMLVGEKVEPVLVSQQWQRRVGAYEIANPGDDTILVDDLRLRYEDGFLRVDYALPLFFDGKLNVSLQPLSDTEAVIRGLGRGMGETIRVVAVNGEEMLQYSGYLLKKKRE
ncbi:serine hydrolase domain-containing protein [Geobacter grbiciae]|uniref:serine hydrolase domain-containing protein n=1 Tax=Geobacter grbiciae TaxID=155042 RepID=UPI001C03033E|nr:serine hydrolase domain-containing protein [Geobacter grbiciae]MBT1075783.1 beta-lactamase family protein [Geobacter grbiciae]